MTTSRNLRNRVVRLEVLETPDLPWVVWRTDEESLGHALRRKGLKPGDEYNLIRVVREIVRPMVG